MREHVIGLGLFGVRVVLVTVVGVTICVGLLFGFNNEIFARMIPETALLIMSVCMIAVATYQVLIHKTAMACMSGMMVGMTVGMLGGFLLGFLVGATNGMFVGALVGVGAGSVLGAVAGRCCGIMGVMEGLMGGLMAGTMGPMLSVMLLVDHYRAFAWLFVLFCASVFGALSIMVEREFKQMGRPPTRTLVRRYEYTVMLSCVVATMMLLLVMVYAPRGPLTIFAAHL